MLSGAHKIILNDTETCMNSYLHFVIDLNPSRRSRVKSDSTDNRRRSQGSRPLSGGARLRIGVPALHPDHVVEKQTPTSVNNRVEPQPIDLVDGTESGSSNQNKVCKSNL